MNLPRLRGLLIILCVCAASSLAAISGELPNGMKYIVEEVSGERGKISAHMHVSVGHLDEEPGEVGYAHLVEHVVFDDNTVFAFNELNSSLHSYGTKNGVSANASTTEQATVYELDLNLREGASLTKGLRFFQSILSNPSFDDKVIQREAKIIMEEWRLRDDFHQRRRTHVIRKGIFADSFFPENWFELIENETLAATAESLQKFRAKHYGPKRTTLIIIGDIDANQVVEQIKTLFGALIDGTQPRQPFALEQRAVINSAAVIQEDIFTEMSVTFGLVDFSGLKNMSDADLGTRVNRKVVIEILNQLVEETLLQDEVLSDSHLDESEYIENTTLLMCKLTSSVSDWKRLTERAVALLNSMTNLSVANSELESIKLKIKSDLSNRLKNINESRYALSQAYADQLNYDTRFKSPIEEISQMQEALKSVTTESVVKAARQWIHNSKGFLVLCLPEHLQSVDNQQLWEKVNHEWSLSPSALPSRKELKEFGNQVLKQANDRKNETASQWANLQEERDSSNWYAYVNEHLFAHFSGDKAQSDELCTLFTKFSLGDRMENGSTQLACSAIEQRMRKLSFAFADAIYSAEAFQSGNNFILRVNFPKKSENIVRAMMQDLIFDFEIRSDQLDSLKKNLSGEHFIMQNYQLLQIAEACLKEALGGRSRSQIKEEIDQTTPESLNNEIRFILGYTPLVAVIDSSSMSYVNARKLFRDIFAGRTGHRIVQPPQHDHRPHISTNNLEVTLNRAGKQALAMVVYQVPNTSEIVQIMVEKFIVSRLQTRIRYDEGLTYAILSSVQSGHMAFYLVCHQDNANKVQETMIEEINRLAVDNQLTYEEFVGLGSKYEVPSWELIKHVEEIETACQQLANQGPALRIQIKTSR